MYQIIDVSGFERDQIEPLGTKSKYWCFDEFDQDYLFKSIETYDANNVLVSRGGEDWSEKISCELAKSLGIPCAGYELAHDGQARGVITRNFVGDDASYLVTANEVLSNHSAPLNREGGKRVEVQDIHRVYVVLRRIVRNKPAGFNSFPDIKTAADFFSGYLMLDALISNQDRHSENWGLIVTGKGLTHLAPTFDHAASLARNESDDTKKSRLLSRDAGQSVKTYVARAKSYFYLRGKRMRTLKAFEYFGILRPAASLAWMDKLEVLTDELMGAIISQVPEDIMSDVSKEFALEMLVSNRSNILAVKPFLQRNLDPVFRQGQIKSYE